MLTDNTLAEKLAARIDFRVEGRFDLEQYFRATAHDSLLCNPSLSQAAVNAELGVGTTKVPANAASIESLLRYHVMNSEQRAHLFARERRVGAWLAFLRYQRVTPSELTKILAIQPSATLASFVVLNPGKFKLSKRRDRETIVDRAAPLEKLRWLAASQPGEHMETAHHWLAEFATCTEIGTTPREDDLFCPRNMLNLLADQRPDLIDTLLDVGGYPYRVTAAASSSLRSQEVQLRVIEPIPSHGGAAIRRWLNQNQGIVHELCENPRTHRATLKEIHARLSAVLFHVFRSDLDRLWNLLRKISQRLDALAYKPTVEENYEKVTDGTKLKYLHGRCAPSTYGVSYHPLDIARLLANENLSPHQRRALTRKMARRGSGLLCKRALSAKLLRSDTWANTPEASASENEARSHLVCDKSCRKGGTCSKARCTGTKWPTKIGLLTVSDFATKMSEDEEYPLYQSAPGDEWIVDQLGKEPSDYATLIALYPTWNGSMGELLETAQALRDTTPV
jgi:hypothetical protein